MKWKTYILLVSLFTSCISASAQVSNRHMVIALLLSKSHFKMFGLSKYEMHLSSQALKWGGPFPEVPIMEVPKYTLPKGNVFCRMEDYVQMHTPMKLNIGVGGQ